METKEILGLDIGAKRTGIARASSVARLAEPLMSVPAEEAVDKLLKYVKDNRVEAIAVGLPRGLQGQDTAQTGIIRNWVSAAKERLATPLYWQDEALTSVHASMKNSGLKNKDDEHALAAAIILQDFLDTPEAARTSA